MKCRDIMSVDLQWISSGASVQSAAQIMRDRSVGMLLVLELGPGVRVAGVVTDRDLAIRGCADARSPTATRVIDVASKEVVACHASDDLAVVEALMRESQKSRVVVLDEINRAVGVVSLTDVLAHDRPGRAVKTARAVLARESGGPHTPLDQIKLTPSTPEDEERASRQHTIALGGTWTGSMREFPA